MDQGVIRSLKAKYRSLAVKKKIINLENSELPKFSILTAMKMLRVAWDSVSNQTFTNCFKKAGISSETVERAVNDEDDLFADLGVEENVVRELEADLEKMKDKFRVDYQMTADEQVDVDLQHPSVVL